MIWLAVAVTGGIGAVGGYLIQLRFSEAPPLGPVRYLAFDAIASAALGLVAGGLLFVLFGDDAVGPVSSGLLFAYLGGAGIPLVFRLVEATERVPTREIVESATAIAVGFAALAGGIALATRVTR